MTAWVDAGKDGVINQPILVTTAGFAEHRQLVGESLSSDTVNVRNFPDWPGSGSRLPVLLVRELLAKLSSCCDHVRSHFQQRSQFKRAHCPKSLGRPARARCVRRPRPQRPNGNCTEDSLASGPYGTLDHGSQALPVRD